MFKLTLKEIKKLINKRKKEKESASFLDVNPEAIGLFFFLWCFLSAFISNTSFIKYIDEDKRQNTIKVTKAEIQISGWYLKLKIGAENTSRFLVHCLGLQEEIRFLLKKRYFMLTSNYLEKDNIL